MEEDGFQSISWDDAPPRAGFADMSSVGEQDEDGFQNISASSSPPGAGPAAAMATSSTSTVRGEAESSKQPRTVNQNAAWDGRWMSIEVKEPVKEHEGSKDMYVSYAVHTRVK